MPSEDTEKSEFNQYLKVSKHFPSGFLISVTSSFSISIMYTEVIIVWKSFVNP